MSCEISSLHINSNRSIHKPHCSTFATTRPTTTVELQILQSLALILQKVIDLQLLMVIIYKLEPSIIMK